MELRTRRPPRTVIIARMHDREHHQPPWPDGPRGTSDEYRKLQRELRSFKEDEKRTEDSIESELRQEHFGKEPERRLAWKTPQDDSNARH